MSSQIPPSLDIYVEIEDDDKDEEWVVKLKEEARKKTNPSPSVIEETIVEAEQEKTVEVNPINAKHDPVEINAKETESTISVTVKNKSTAIENLEVIIKSEITEKDFGTPVDKHTDETTTATNNLVAELAKDVIIKDANKSDDDDDAGNLVIDEPEKSDDISQQPNSELDGYTDTVDYTKNIGKLRIVDVKSLQEKSCSINELQESLEECLQECLLEKGTDEDQNSASQFIHSSGQQKEIENNEIQPEKDVADDKTVEKDVADDKTVEKNDTQLKINVQNKRVSPKKKPIASSETKNSFIWTNEVKAITAGVNDAFVVLRNLTLYFDDVQYRRKTGEVQKFNFICHFCGVTLVDDQEFTRHLGMSHKNDSMFIAHAINGAIINVFATTEHDLPGLTYDSLQKEDFYRNCADKILAITHTLVANSIVAYKCYICLKTWEHYSQFLKHLIDHKNNMLYFLTEFERKLSCVFLVVSNTTVYLSRELPLYNDSEHTIYKCFKCNSNFGDRKSFVEHAKSRECPSCRKRFLDCSLFKKHLGSCRLYFANAFPKICQCGVCIFSKEQRAWHKCNMNAVLGFNCVTCNFLATTQELLTKHQLEEHIVRSDKLMQNQNKTCKLCHQKYVVRDYHFCVARGFMHQCEVCHRQFQNSAMYLTHKLCTQKRLKCLQCNEIVLCTCLLIPHCIEKHTSNFTYIFKCGYCTEYFTKEEILHHKHGKTDFSSGHKLLVAKSQLVGNELIIYKKKEDSKEVEDLLRNIISISYIEDDDLNLPGKPLTLKIVPNDDEKQNTVVDSCDLFIPENDESDHLSVNETRRKLSSGEKQQIIESNNINQMKVVTSDNTEIDINEMLKKPIHFISFENTTENLHIEIDYPNEEPKSIFRSHKRKTPKCYGRRLKDHDKVTGVNNIDATSDVHNDNQIMSEVKVEVADTEVNVINTANNPDISKTGFERPSEVIVKIEKENLEVIIKDEIEEIDPGDENEYIMQEIDDIKHETEVEFDDIDNFIQNTDEISLDESDILNVDDDSEDEPLNKKRRGRKRTRCLVDYLPKIMAQPYCNKCNKKPKTLEYYVQHLFSEHGYQLHECPQCHRIQNSERALMSHITSHVRKLFYKNIVYEDNASKRLFQCMKCDKTVSETNHFRHWDKHLSIADNKTIEESDKGNEVDMLVDALTADTDYYRKMNRGVKCLACPKVFNRYHCLKVHLSEHLLNHALKFMSGGLLTCQVCGRKMQKKDFRGHMRRHSGGITVYTCKICEMTFSDSSNFSKHRKKHNTQLYVCDMCNRKFNTKPMIEKHMMHHNKECLFRCAACNEAFVCIRDKWDHEFEKHGLSKERFDCHLCNARFRKLMSLRRHLKAHSFTHKHS